MRKLIPILYFLCILASFYFFFARNTDLKGYQNITVSEPDEKTARTFPAEGELFFDQERLIIKTTKKTLLKEPIASLNPNWQDFAINIQNRKISVRLRYECVNGDIAIQFIDQADWEIYQLCFYGE